MNTISGYILFFLPKPSSAWCFKFTLTMHMRSEIGIILITKALESFRKVTEQRKKQDVALKTQLIQEHHNRLLYKKTFNCE